MIKFCRKKMIYCTIWYIDTIYQKTKKLSKVLSCIVPTSILDIKSVMVNGNGCIQFKFNNKQIVIMCEKNYYFSFKYHKR